MEILFEQLKVLPPRSFEEVSKKLEELKDRESLFERACSEEISEKDKEEIENIKG